MSFIIARSTTECPLLIFLSECVARWASTDSMSIASNCLQRSLSLVFVRLWSGYIDVVCVLLLCFASGLAVGPPVLCFEDENASVTVNRWKFCSLCVCHRQFGQCERRQTEKCFWFGMFGCRCASPHIDQFRMTIGAQSACMGCVRNARRLQVNASLGSCKCDPTRNQTNQQNREFL